MKRTLALMLVAVSLAAPQAASAAYNPLGGGATTIAFSHSLLSLLKLHHVKIRGSGGARLHGARASLPAAAGEVDPGKGLGTVESRGTLEFAAGPRKVKLRQITFKAKHAPLYAKVGGGQLKLVTARKLRPKRVGFGASFTAAGLRFTAKFAQRLNKKLGLGRSLKAGQLLGTIAVSTQPTTVHLAPAGRLSLAIDPAFYEKLNKQFVSVNPIAPAELAPGHVLSFPVGLESALAPDGRSGLVKLGGSVELLQLGNAQYFWRELQLEAAVPALASETDLQPSPPQPGRAPEAPLFTIGAGAAATADAASRVIELKDQTAVLPATTAATLNAAFAEGKPLFAAGETVGTIALSVTAE